jgi:uncharacterized protein DUF929
VSTRRAVARKPVRKPVRRTPPWVVPAAVVAGIALVVATFFLIRWYITPQQPKQATPDTTQAVVNQITTIPTAEFEAVGQGTANNLVKPISGTPLTCASGKPLILYMGAEYCPYCAAQRWALIIALSRFGTFSGLHTTTSSSSDVFPDTPTFTFHGASYTSEFVEFRAVEQSDRDKQPLETASAADQAVYDKFGAGSIPFIDFGNRYVLNAATYSPDVLGGGNWRAIADEVRDPNSSQARAIVGSANLLTAAICKNTADKPAPVCSSAGIQALEKKLG